MVVVANTSVTVPPSDSIAADSIPMIVRASTPVTVRASTPVTVRAVDFDSVDNAEPIGICKMGIWWCCMYESTDIKSMHEEAAVNHSLLCCYCNKDIVAC
jgi:hypothetical protein